MWPFNKKTKVEPVAEPDSVSWRNHELVNRLRASEGTCVDLSKQLADAMADRAVIQRDRDACRARMRALLQKIPGAEMEDIGDAGALRRTSSACGTCGDIAALRARASNSTSGELLCWVCFNDRAREEREREEKRGPLATQVGGEHYKTLAIQPAEYTTRNGIGHLAGDAIAYITRYKAKNGRQDLEKAIHSLQILIALEYPET